MYERGMRPTAEVWVGRWFWGALSTGSRVKSTAKFNPVPNSRLSSAMNERTAGGTWTDDRRAQRVVYATTVPRERDAWPRMTGARIATDRTDVAASRPDPACCCSGLSTTAAKGALPPVRICSTQRHDALAATATTTPRDAADARPACAPMTATDAVWRAQCVSAPLQPAHSSR